jgi:BlaI family penicillinase repressor
MSLPQISEAEFEVMKIVWKYAPINTNEITEKLTLTTSWSPKTIQTLIKRLVSKKALSYEKQSRVFVYTPLVQEDEYIRQESNSFLKRYYNGNLLCWLLTLKTISSLQQKLITYAIYYQNIRNRRF